MEKEAEDGTLKKLNWFNLFFNVTVDVDVVVVALACAVVDGVVMTQFTMVLFHADVNGTFLPFKLLFLLLQFILSCLLCLLLLLVGCCR